MTRRLASVLAAALVLAACGSGDDAEPVNPSDEPAAETSEPADEPADTTDAGAGDAGATDTTAPAAAGAGHDAPDGFGVEKPAVEVPATEPTELVVTDLVEGSGDEAEVGDTVVVQYVGVLSSDGTEFDNSYDRGQPFPVTVGVGAVIDGWDQGLLGVQAGTRRQLDIPPTLAYGESGAGDVIPPNAALSFVVDVLEVQKRVPPTVPEQADPSECPATDGSAPTQQEFDGYPPFCIDVDASYTAEIVTNVGDVVVELHPDKAPLTVNNFVMLARYHFFDGTECHRAIPGFVVQCGDPTATGTGGPGYRFPDELPLPGEYEIGSLAMANSRPDNNGSQFFIVTGPNGTELPPSYSLFGTVIEGLDTTVPALDALGNPKDNGVPPLEQIIIESVTVTGP